MARFLVILLLSIGIFLQSGRQLLLYGWYLIHQEYLTENYCVNKSRPELECHAMCYMSDVLDEKPEEPGEAPMLPSSPVEESLLVKLLPANPFLKISFPLTGSKTALLSYLFLYAFQPVSDFFHPPR
jgi:hypothetical protein